VVEHGVLQPPTFIGIAKGAPRDDENLTLCEGWLRVSREPCEKPSCELTGDYLVLDAVRDGDEVARFGVHHAREDDVHCVDDLVVDEHGGSSRAELFYTPQGTVAAGCLISHGGSVVSAELAERSAVSVEPPV
jgi:hypothetical protein